MYYQVVRGNGINRVLFYGCGSKGTHSIGVESHEVHSIGYDPGGSEGICSRRYDSTSNKKCNAEC